MLSCTVHVVTGEFEAMNQTDGTSLENIARSRPKSSIWSYCLYKKKGGEKDVPCVRTLAFTKEKSFKKGESVNFSHHPTPSQKTTGIRLKGQMRKQTQSPTAALLFQILSVSGAVC